MANGFWGSRFPLMNLLCTRFVFLAVRWRIVTRRLKNRLARGFRPDSIQKVNLPESTEKLKRELDAGLDRLNLGGGAKALKAFINVDFASHPGIEHSITANILDLSFVPNHCASQIHSNHVLEHLPEGELQSQFREYHRILNESGLLTLRCPNALGATYGFWMEPILEEEGDEFRSLGFPSDEDFGNPKDRWLHKDLFGLLHWLYGDMGNPQNEHLSLITPTKLRTLVETAGFRILKMSAPESLNLVLVARKTPKDAP